MLACFSMSVTCYSHVALQASDANVDSHNGNNNDDDDDDDGDDDDDDDVDNNDNTNNIVAL